MRYFGFGFMGFGGLQTATANGPAYSPQEFVDAMFGTPPFPSTCQFNWVDNNTGGQAFGPNNPQTIYSEEVLDLLATSYPNVKIALSFGYNITDPNAQAALFALIQSLASRASATSIGVIGFDTEQTGTVTPAGTSSVVWDSAYAALQQLVINLGYDFGSYYPGGYKGTASVMDTLDWFDGPDASVPAPGLLLSNASYPVTGITQAGAAYQVFPDTGCGVNGKPKWTLNPYPAGAPCPTPAPPGCTTCLANSYPDGNWPPSIAQAMQYNGIVNLEVKRKWCFLNAGLSGNGYGGGAQGVVPVLFTGVSGFQTAYLWEHPMFRQAMADWISANPGIFIQSGGTAPPPPPPIKSNVVTVTVS